MLIMKLIQLIVIVAYLLDFKLMAWTSHASLTFSMTAYIWQKNAPGPLISHVEHATFLTFST